LLSPRFFTNRGGYQILPKLSGSLPVLPSSFEEIELQNLKREVEAETQLTIDRQSQYFSVLTGLEAEDTF
jgi:hypothetical protein